MPVSTHPRASDVYVDPALTSFAQKGMQSVDNFAATRAFPGVPVTKQSGKYHVWNADDLHRNQVKPRAPGTEATVTGYDISRENYDCEEYALAKDVDEETEVNADAVIQPYMDATSFVSGQCMQHKEKVVADRVFKANTWDSNPSVGAGWNTATGNPIKDIRDAKRAVHGRSGFRPNRVLLGREAYDAILDNANVLDRIKGGATTNQLALVMKTLLAGLFEVDSVEVMDGVETTTKKGASTQTQSFIVSDKCLVYYAPQVMVASGEQPTAACFFNWASLVGTNEMNFRVERMPIPLKYSQRVTVRAAYDFRVTGKAFGAYFSDTNS